MSWPYNIIEKREEHVENQVLTNMWLESWAQQYWSVDILVLFDNGNARQGLFGYYEILIIDDGTMT